MVKTCSVGKCLNRQVVGKKKGEEGYYGFYAFPTHLSFPERRAKWAWLCGRKDEVTGKPWAPKHGSNSVYICSAHFVSGNPSRLPGHPDFLPNLNLPNSQQRDLEARQKSLQKFESRTRKSLAEHLSQSYHHNNDFILDRSNAPRDADLVDDDKDSTIDQPDGSNIDTSPVLPDVPTFGEPLEDFLVENVESASATLLQDINKESHIDEDEKDIRIADLERQLKESQAKVMVAEENNKLLQEQLEESQAKEECLVERTEYLLARLNTVRFSSEVIYQDDHKSKLYTGLCWETFLTIFQYLLQFTPTRGRPPVLLPIDQFFLCLVRLRHNDVFEKLADHAGVMKQTAIDYFWKWCNLFPLHLDHLIQWPDRDYIRKVAPPEFRAAFPRLTSIIDCFEVFIESSSILLGRAQTYSTYKSHTTVKYLIACNPLGAVCFLSRGWGGRVSDIYLTRESGFINPTLHYPGDQILADRGFTLVKEFAEVCGAELILPAFIKGRDHFNGEEIDCSRKIASIRIHIERIIGEIKNRFAIMQQTLPTRVIKSIRDEVDCANYASIDKIVTACAILVNLTPGIVYKEGEVEETALF